jgi:ribulose bisphosphate carboxylase small subunit
MSDIDAYSQGKKVLGGIDFTDESRYVEVDPGSGDLVLKRHNNQQTVATVSNLRLDPDKAYTVLLVGSDDKPRTVVLEDRVQRRPAMPQYPLAS